MNEPTDNSGRLPSDKFSAWTEAENEALRILCEATGMTAGTNAFIGETKADIVNSFYIYNDPVQYGGEVFYAPKPGTVALKYTAVGQFLSRAAAQRWAMQIVCALPVHNRGNIQHFRMDNTGIGAIKADTATFRAEVGEQPFYVLPITFDLVFEIR